MIKRKLSIKWFGSLTNLRRKSDAQKDEGPSDMLSVKEISTDDMGMHPRSPSYASSSEMYTHMGTMPRHKKKDRSLKKNKSKDKTNLGRSQSLRPSQDYVVDSPLLSVLSGKGLEALEKPIMEDKPAMQTRDIQNRDLPPPPTLDGCTTEQGTADKEPVLDSMLHVNQPAPCVQSSDVLPPNLSLTKGSKVQPVLPMKRHKGDTSMKGAEELHSDSNLINLPLKIGSYAEQKKEQEANMGSGCKQDNKEEKEPNRKLDTTDSQGEYVECCDEEEGVAGP